MQKSLRWLIEKLAEKSSQNYRKYLKLEYLLQKIQIAQVSESYFDSLRNSRIKDINSVYL